MNFNYRLTSDNPVTTFPRKQYINNGQTNVKMGMPQKFAVSDGTASFSLGRKLYINSYNNTNLFSNAMTDKSPKNGKPIVSNSAGQHIEQKKNNAIGRATTNKNGNTFSYRSQDNNLVNHRVQRCRSGGCVAPAKKGASKN